MAKGIAPNVPSAPNDATTLQKLASGIQNAMRTVVVQEMIMNQKVRYIVVDAACHVTITSDMLFEMVIGKIPDAVSPILGVPTAGASKLVNTGLQWPAWMAMTQNVDWVLFAVVAVCIVFFLCTTKRALEFVH